MFEQGLDDLERSNNTMVQFMNRRTDRIMESVNAVMHDEGMMGFASMALGLPLLGLGLTFLGAPPAILALMSVAAPMSLLMHLTNGSPQPSPSEVHVLHFNLTAPINEENTDYEQ